MRDSCAKYENRLTSANLGLDPAADGRDGAERGDGATGEAVCAGGAERPKRESSDLGEISARSTCV